MGGITGTTGSVTTGSVTTGSVTTGSVTTGSVTTGSATTGSIGTTGGATGDETDSMFRPTGSPSTTMLW